MATAVLVGAGITAAAVAGRFILRAVRSSSAAGVAANAASAAGAGAGAGASVTKSSFFDFLTKPPYYKGGFEQVMNRKEAALILGVSTATPKEKVREAHKKIMLLNHPDRGGSPYLASKINTAKDLLESNKQTVNDKM